jgi:hypothetical protein
MSSTASTLARPLPDPAWDAKRFPPALHRNRIVSTLKVNRDPIGELCRARDEIGPVYTLRVLNHPGGIVCAADVETNRQVLTDHARFSAGDAADLIEPLVGKHSLILTPVPTHTRNRKLLMPPFHGEKITRWTEVIADLVDQHLPYLVTRDSVAIRPWAQRLTLDVILRVVFGIESAERRDVYRAALDHLMNPRIAPFLFLPNRLRGGVFNSRRRDVDALLDEDIAARRADPDAENKYDVLSVLLAARDENGDGFTHEELRDELKGLVLAGHETTATAIAWTLHFLAHNPEARDKLLADLAAGNKDYLNATIKESMRLRAPVFDAIRMATADTELAGQPVPAGALVAAMFCVMQLDPEVWPEPEKFRPERFLADHGDKPVGAPPAGRLAAASGGPWAWTPFGGGSRRCIGASLAQLELDVVLSRLLQQVVPEPAGPLEGTRLLGVTLIPAEGGRVRLRPAGVA